MTMKTSFLMTACIVSSTTAAMAMPASDAQSMTCGEIHQAIAQNGMMVLRYPSKTVQGMMLYNRYVSNAMSCVGQGSMSSATVAASDDPKCKVKLCGQTTGKGPAKGRRR